MSSEVRMSDAKPGTRWGCWLGGIALAALAFMIVFRPESFRTGLQVPVSVSMRTSYVGVGNVVVIKNVSKETLENVTVTGRNSAMNQTAQYRIGRMRPGEVVEVGWTKWKWQVGPGESITVSNDRYLPIVFTADQLGVR